MEPVAVHGGIGMSPYDLAPALRANASSQPVRAPATTAPQTQDGIPRTAKKTIVFILSTSYSGSHYLSLMLGSHSRAMHLGEIHRVRQGNRLRLAHLCFACRERGFCPVFSGIAPDEVGQVYDTIFSRIDPAVEVLVDNSKLARGWAEQFLNHDGYERKYVHLIRDPRALVRRWMLKQTSWLTGFRRRWRIARAFPHRLLTASFGSAPDVLTYQWLLLNRRITDFIAQHRLDAQVLTYHDLARYPDVELRKLTEWVGLPYESGQSEYWKFPHHGTQKTEYEWVKKERSQHIDVRWKTELDAALQERITVNADVETYLNGLGLRMGPDGLTGRRRPR
jgi:hypothetical protein